MDFFLTNIKDEKTSRTIINWLFEKVARRKIAVLGGTTNLADCLAAMRFIMNPSQMIHGSSIEEYEQAFARQIGVRYAYSFSSGRVGLYGLLRALNIGLGDEVLLQVPTHIVIPNAIRYTGARPVYVDCELNTYNMDLDKAEHFITQKTKVLLLQHTFGIPVNMDKALDIANQYGLIVIEDCVHALGSKYNGKQIGSFGKAAFFSTEETKTISTTMGGLVVTDDPEIAKKVKDFQENCLWPSYVQTFRYLLKFILYHLLTEPYMHRYTRALYELFGRCNPLPKPTNNDEQHGLKPVVYEQRLSNAQAALGLRQLSRLNDNINHRRKVSKLYKDLLSHYGYRVPQPPSKAEPVYLRYPIWLSDRPSPINLSVAHTVLGTWFTSVLEEAVSPVYGSYEKGSCPVAEEVAKHLVNLPTHPRVNTDDTEAIMLDVLNTFNVV